jgi:putative hemolysin
MKNLMNKLNKMTQISLATVALSSSAFAGGSSTVGPANPAAVNCLKLGGTLERVVTPEGEDANCRIEEWKLFRAMSEQNLVKPHHYGNGAMPNPAAVNCIDIGGELRSVTTPNGEAGVCVIEEWKLFRVIRAK